MINRQITHASSKLTQPHCLNRFGLCLLYRAVGSCSSRPGQPDTVPPILAPIHVPFPFLPARWQTEAIVLAAASHPGECLICMLTASVYYVKTLAHNCNLLIVHNIGWGLMVDIRRWSGIDDLCYTCDAFWENPPKCSEHYCWPWIFVTRFRKIHHNAGWGQKIFSYLQVL